ETCTGFSESQPVESHQEKLPTPTTTVSGVRYYGYRYYLPEVGRWPSRDPIGEIGWWTIYKMKAPSLQLLRMITTVVVKSEPAAYLLLFNSPIDRYDANGLVGSCVCSSGSHSGKKGKPGYAPTVNGCGAANGAAGQLVPNDPMSAFPPHFSCPFTDACNNHDLCYGWCNSDKSTCDYNLYQAIQGACLTCYEAHFPWWNPLGWIWLGDCASLAGIYYAAVSAGGGSPFNDAQNEACEPCCCP
ncbi:MAG: hypothetical protein WCO77_13385, partial [bacterium]